MGQRIAPGLTPIDKLNALTAPPEGEQDVLAGIKLLMDQAKDKQALEDESLAGLKDKIQAFESKEPGLNLSAGFALVDTLTGSNLTSKIKDKSLSKDERDAAAINMRSDLLNRLEKIRSGKEKNAQDIQLELLGLRSARDIASEKNTNLRAISDQNNSAKVEAAGAKTDNKLQSFIDKEAAKVLIDYDYKGGGAEAAKSLDNLRGVRDKLKDPVEGKKLTGFATGAGLKAGSIGEGVVSLFNEDAKAAQDMVQSSVLGSIKEAVGGNPTAQETNKILGYAYDPSLSADVNHKRLTRTITALEKARASKLRTIEYLKKNNTMAGFEGSQPSIADIEKELGLDQNEPKTLEDKKKRMEELKAKLNQ